MKVSRRAAIGRINRKLAHYEQKLHKTRRWNSDLRNYYVHDWSSNRYIAVYDSLEQAVEDTGVLEKYESLAD